MASRPVRLFPVVRLRGYRQCLGHDMAGCGQPQQHSTDHFLAPGTGLLRRCHVEGDSAEALQYRQHGQASALAWPSDWTQAPQASACSGASSRNVRKALLTKDFSSLTANSCSQGTHPNATKQRWGSPTSAAIFEPTR